MSDLLTPDQIAGLDDYPADASVKLNGPPGTGKTSQTKSRLHLLVDSDEFEYSMRDVGFVTYRRSLADEFLEDAEGDLLPEGAVEAGDARSAVAEIGTLHSVCLSLHPRDQEAIADDSEKAAFVDEAYDGAISYRSQRGEYGKPMGERLFAAHQWQRENLTTPERAVYESDPGSYLQDNLTNPVEKLRAFGETWEQYKDDHGMLDFVDMIEDAATEGYYPDASVLAFDEYHDFTPLMDRLARMWIADVQARDGVAIVNGDPLQALYVYKGASPSFYEDLDLPEIQLDKSWRVPRNIWDYATDTLSPQHTPPSVEPTDREGHVEERDSCEFRDGSATGTGTQPFALYEEYLGGAEYEADGPDGMFYLARINKQVADISRNLKKAGIVYDTHHDHAGWGGADTRRGVYNVLAGLSNVADPRGGNRSQTSLVYDEWDEGRAPESVTFPGADLAAFFEKIKADRLDRPKKEVVAYFRDKPDAEFTANDLADYVKDEAFGMLTRGHASVSNLLDSYDDADVIANALHRYGDRQFSEADCGRVKVQTIHASKGGERDYVALYSGVTNAIRNDMTGYEDERDEARVWYVGATRARRDLVVMRNGWSFVKDHDCPTAAVLGKHRRAATDGGQQ